MVNFLSPAFIILTSTGILVWLICLYLLRHPPKSINKNYGYRTPRSLKSQEAWDYAQISGPKNMLHGAQIMCFLGIASLFLPFDEVVASFIAIGITLASILLPMVLTERALKEKFG